jgi:hypothetical protein
MVGFIDNHRRVYGVESISGAADALSTHFRYKAQRPIRPRSARAQRREELRAIIRRILTEHLGVWAAQGLAANGTREFASPAVVFAV